MRSPNCDSAPPDTMETPHVCMMRSPNCDSAPPDIRGISFCYWWGASSVYFVTPEALELMNDEWASSVYFVTPEALLLLLLMRGFPCLFCGTGSAATDERRTNAKPHQQFFFMILRESIHRPSERNKWNQTKPYHTSQRLNDHGHLAADHRSIQCNA